MLHKTYTTVEALASDMSEVETTPIEWPTAGGADVLEYEDSFDFGAGVLTAKTTLDLTERDEDDPVTGSYTVSTDGEETIWLSELLLDTNGEEGPEVTMTSSVEVGNEPGARYMSTSLSVIAKSGAGVDDDSPGSGPVVLSFVFDFI